MELEFSYPFNVRKQDMEYIVTFPDVPEAITGASNRHEAIELARDALLAALGAYVEDKLPIPRPSAKKPKQFMAYLRPLEAAKLGLYIAMQENNINNVGLAKRLGVDEKTVRRWLDLDYNNAIEAIRNAMRRVFNYRLVTSMKKAA